jgi:ABC-type phosphate/phosphonate transport system substrate-binding protein
VGVLSEFDPKEIVAYERARELLHGSGGLVAIDFNPGAMLKQMARQPGISRLLAALGMLGLLAASVWSSPGYSQTEMTIGVLAFRGKQDALERWGPTAQYLSQSISDHSFKIVPLTLEGMLSRVEQDRLDFILTNTGNYVVLENAFGISRLATLKVRQFAADFTQFGAVIITRRGHPDLNQLEDIAGHSLMAVSEEAFGGFQMAWRELIDVGIDPFEDLQSLQFAGFPQDDIVHAVIAGEVDAGTVRSGTIERMAADGLIDIEQIRVLGSRDSKSFPFLHSTRLYPEWPFAKARKTSQELAQRVARPGARTVPGARDRSIRLFKETGTGAGLAGIQGLDNIQPRDGAGAGHLAGVDRAGESAYFAI